MHAQTSLRHHPLRQINGTLLSLSLACAALGEPLLTTTQTHEWTLRIDARLTASRARFTDGGLVTRPVFRTQFKLDDAIVAFPLIASSATSDAAQDQLHSALQLNHNVHDDTPDILENYQAGERIGLWRLGPSLGTELSLSIEVPVTTRNVKLNERAAMQTPWWDDANLPPVARSALLPQAFVESDDPHIVEFVKRITRDRARTVPPALLAKFLAGVVVERFQPANGGQEFNARGGYAGLDIIGASAALQTWSGSVFDMAALTCALYRAAGLPARVVIAYDVIRSQGLLAGLPAAGYPCGQTNAPASGAPAMHAWVEFFLLTNTKKHTGEWIPVDVFRQREFGSTPPPLDQPWQFFGSHPCAFGLIPISFHFHPPLEVISGGAPAMWGWLPTPFLPVVDQELRFDAFTMPRTGD